MLIMNSNFATLDKISVSLILLGLSMHTYGHQTQSVYAMGPLQTRYSLHLSLSVATMFT